MRRQSLRAQTPLSVGLPDVHRVEVVAIGVRAADDGHAVAVLDAGPLGDGLREGNS